jgi:hypothetical protein
MTGAGVCSNSVCSKKADKDSHALQVAALLKLRAEAFTEQLAAAHNRRAQQFGMSLQAQSE